jgi:uncharacterized protein (DUF1697 family)
METAYIALLRGINVGGKNVIKMGTLKQCFVEMGFFDVQTYIQSGNVIFKTQEIDELKLIENTENQLLKTFSIEIKTAIFSANELKKIVENAPKNFGSEPDKYRYDVWFLMPSITAEEMALNVRLREGIDTLQTGEHVLYTTRLTAEMNKSHLQKIIGTPMYQYITIRNWNTTTKLLKLA